jgi:hypothetical protein
MRATWLVALAACGSDPDLVTDAHILVDGFDSLETDCRSQICVHNENTDLFDYAGATFLVHRTAESQILGPNSSLRVSRSDDHGKTWNLLAILPAIADRDLRDPCFYTMPDGKLGLKALTRLPVTSDRDSNVDTITVGAQSADGATWTPLAPMAPETWSFWRIQQHAGMYFDAAYEDGDKSVRLFTSTDGTTWTIGPAIYDVSEDTPLETELIFYDDSLLALVRMDGTNDELLGSQGRLRTAACWAVPPYASFDCSQILDGVRLDGPVAFADSGRQFVVARKHILGVRDTKRTALYELVGPAGGPLQVVEHAELPSSGDTAYAGIARIDEHRFLTTWYSSLVTEDQPWARALLGPTDIWQATIDLRGL